MNIKFTKLIDEKFFEIVGHVWFDNRKKEHNDKIEVNESERQLNLNR